MICKKLSPISVHFLSPLLIMSFDARKFWILMKFSVSVFSLVVMLLMSYFKNHRLGFTPVSFWEFVILVLTFRSLIHFELIFRWCEIEVRFILLQWIFSCPAPFVEKTILSPLNGLGIFVRNQLAVDIWNYSWTLNSISLVYTSILMPIPQFLNYYSSVVSFF